MVPAPDSLDTPPVADDSTVDGRSLVATSPQVVSSAYLLLFQGDSTRMVPLPAEGEFVIGRGEGCDLRLDEHRVSRTHARLSLLGGQARLTDLGSQNGTLVNDELIAGQRPLTSGDVVTIAGVDLHFHAPQRGVRGPGVLESAQFRARAELELERSTRFSRPLTVIGVRLSPAPDRARLQPTLEAALRRIDLASWVANDALALLCPEADAEQGTQLAERLLETLATVHPGVRAGLAVCPDDGADLETLLASAKAAAASAHAGELAMASNAFRSLTIGERTVLVADAAMTRLYELVQRLSASDLPVLIQGETGTGKELVAHAVHHGSRRSPKRLLAVNCAALQETLLESELFGHERGAFTGAVASKPGLFEQVGGGTIFLDEIGETSPALQAKLLRALETRRITRLGDTREREVDFRVVAATHRDLQAEVKAGRFREDLFFRLAGATVWLPPLRDRKRELPLLARRFLDEGCAKAGRAAPVLAPETLRLLAEHAWPGNVRELRNVMEFAAATVTDAAVEPWHLRDRLGGAPPAPPPGSDTPAPGPTPAFRPINDELRELEQRRMLDALEATEWNQTRAAAALSMPLRTFVTRFKQFGLSRHSR